MNRLAVATLGSAIAWAATVHAGQSEAPGGGFSLEAANGLISEYRVMCHSDEALTGGLTLESFDAAAPERDPETAEKVTKKLVASRVNERRLSSPSGARRSRSSEAIP